MDAASINRIEILPRVYVASCEVTNEMSTKEPNNGARHWSVGLHVHTPCINDVTLETYCSSTPDGVVQAAHNAALTVIAFTYHNTAELCEVLTAASEQTEPSDPSGCWNQQR